MSFFLVISSRGITVVLEVVVAVSYLTTTHVISVLLILETRR